METIQRYLDEMVQIIERLDRNSISNVVKELVALRDRNGRLFIIGSGGGAGHASHACCDFRKLCNIEAYCPTDNVSELSARINDEGWDGSLAAMLTTSRFSTRDALLVFSVGGGDEERKVSVNLVSAVKLARGLGACVLGVVGRNEGYVAKHATACVVIPTIDEKRITPHTEAFQAVIWHLLVSQPELQINATKW